MSNFGLVTRTCDICTTGTLTYFRGVQTGGTFIPSRQIEQSVRDAALDRPDACTWADGVAPVIEDAPCWKCDGARAYDVEYVACKIF